MTRFDCTLCRDTYVCTEIMCRVLAADLAARHEAYIDNISAEPDYSALRN